jgi:F-type H+-transporting ATPase subunit b
MKKLTFLFVALAANPAFASEEGPFVSLRNAHFVILVAFLIFIGVLLKYKVPGMLLGMLDKRAEGIKADLAEARALRDEAQTILASYERKAREVQAQADDIVVAAKRDAQLAAEQAKADLKVAIARRLKGAEDRIASAEAAALKDVKDRAVQVAIAAAAEVRGRQMSAADKSGMIDTSIAEVKTRLN